jgi:hypothetical protein
MVLDQSFFYLASEYSIEEVWRGIIPPACLVGNLNLAYYNAATAALSDLRCRASDRLWSLRQAKTELTSDLVVPAINTKR